MIQLTRLNNTKLGVNSELIKFIEASPDTVITMTTGEKVVVKESFEEISRKTAAFRRAMLIDGRTGEGDFRG
ncbi:MAG TPA: flagellar FlbD family protein [Acidisarcina sp.]